MSVSRPTQQYAAVRVQDGFGWVDLGKNRVLLPPGGKKPRSQGRKTEGFLFRVVEIPTPVAVLLTESGVEDEERVDEHRAVDLLLDHVEQVAWVDEQAGGAALGEAYSNDDPSAPNAACAMAAVAADTSPLDLSEPLVFNVKGEQSNTVTVWLKKAEEGYQATAFTPRMGTDDILKTVKQDLRSGNGCSLLLANLDRSMALNDRYGFRFGDLVLARIHRLFELEEPGSDAEFYRVGGDEFAFLVPGSNTRQTDAMAERIRQGVNDMNIPLRLEGRKGKGVDRVTISVGVVHVPPDARRSPKEVWQIAQFTIWKAKEAGRNNVKVAAAI